MGVTTRKTIPQAAPPVHPGDGHPAHGGAAIESRRARQASVSVAPGSKPPWATNEVPAPGAGSGQELPPREETALAASARPAPQPAEQDTGMDRAVDVRVDSTWAGVRLGCSASSRAARLARLR